MKERKVKVKSFSRVLLFATPWTVAYQASPSMEFSRQEYWSGLPFPSSEDLPDPGIEPRSPKLQADALPSEPPGKPYPMVNHHGEEYESAASQVTRVEKNLPANAGDLRDAGLIPGSGRSPGVGNGNPNQYYCLGNLMDRGAWLQSMGSQRVGHD